MSPFCRLQKDRRHVIEPGLSNIEERTTNTMMMKPVAAVLIMCMNLTDDFCAANG